MHTFKKRSDKKELLDEPGIPFIDIRQNMKELEVVNQRLGGHKITLKAIKNILSGGDNASVHIVELGSGGGDNLKVIQEWAFAKNQQVNLTGIDLNPECISYARQVPGQENISFIQSDYRLVDFKSKPDIIFSSLFCHHFSDDELISQLQWMHNHSSVGFFINDLHRHPLAFYSIKLLTKMFSKSYLVKHDAPLSVQRAFKKTDWQQLMHKAGLKEYKLKWMWAFRWLLLYRHDGNYTSF